MSSTTHLQTLYKAILALPEGVNGELIDGQLYTQPRPSARHGLAAIRLGADLVRPFDRGHDGPGGWWIIGEPEVHLALDRELVVPDIAGWRRERMPVLPDDQRFTVIPDWVCEVLSPLTASKDREIKMPLYARYGIPYVWLIDPRAPSLEAYAMTDGEWERVACFAEHDLICAPPFDAVTLDPPWE